MRIGIQITKSTPFRGVEQEFHNVYHFWLDTAVTAPSSALIDELVTTEKALHSSAVNFRRAACWTAGGTKQQNSMLLKKNLTGTGSQTGGTSMDRERAVLIRWPAGFDSRGNPVYLRKYYHSCGSAAGQTLDTATILQNISQIPQTARDAIAAKAEECREVGVTEFWELCAASGRQVEGGAQCHPYLEHHQLGDMWRV